jgi:hypothetical protein
MGKNKDKIQICLSALILCATSDQYIDQDGNVA